MKSVVSLDVRTLYEAEVGAVHAFLGTMGLSGPDLEDAVHDTFVTALTRRETYDPSRPAKPWLLGIAFRVMVARVRRASTKQELLEAPPDRADPAPDPERTLEEKRRWQLVQRALAELPEAQATVFVLFDLQGQPAAEIARTMDTPVATTYSRLRLAREAFAVAVRKLRGKEAA